MRNPDQSSASMTTRTVARHRATSSQVTHVVVQTRVPNRTCKYAAEVLLSVDGGRRDQDNHYDDH